jgi:hypothetical protein
MNEHQESIIRCAYLDLIGAQQAHDQDDIEAHDWKAHALTIEELLQAFPFLENAVDDI